MGFSGVPFNDQVKKISSATDNAVVRWDGTTGNIVQDSAVTIDDNGSVDIPTGQTYKINSTTVVDQSVASGAAPVLAATNFTGLPMAAFKEYGLTITNGTDTEHDLDIAAGTRWDSTYATSIVYAGGTIALDASGAGGLDTGSPANSTQYYIWLCKGTSGVTAIFSASASAPTLPSGYDSYKVCIGRVITDGSANINNTMMWAKHYDSTESFVYTQLTGNFPNANATVTHSLNTNNLDVSVYAENNANSTLHPLFTIETAGEDKQFVAYYIGATNTIEIFKGTLGFFIPPVEASIANSADYSLVVRVRTRLT